MMGSQTDDTSDADDPVRRVLGYLNFSSGAPDPLFLSSLDKLFQIASARTEDQPIWVTVCADLSEAVEKLAGTSPAFAETQQAKDILQLLSEFCPAYRSFHCDLLPHLAENRLFGSFFVGRATEALLGCHEDGADVADVIQKAIHRMSDYIGYRPVATLESQKIEPYRHEWIRPLPVHIAGAGTATGDYHDIVEKTVRVLHATDARLLQEAYFDPNKLDELAIDPRVYDFDHPANRRPNHHFGMWDPQHIDGDGFYRRFVVQQVTIDALLRRVEETKSISRDELLDEAAAVLAGTVLMASGISGYGPETHDSTVSLTSLLVKIAAYRDAFYEQLLEQTKGSHGARLRDEAKRLQQPFAGARQDLNRQLTQCRATQLQCVQLSKIYARMNYDQAAESQSSTIQVPSARLITRIDCKLSQARTAMDTSDLAEAPAAIEEARGHLLRGIECGAIVDPWNILGFDGNFSLFGSVENTLRDYRIDDLVEIIEEMLELYARLWGKAAATQQTDIAARTRQSFEDFVNWWHQFAAHEIDSVDAEDPLDVYDAAKNVAEALEAWHQHGEASGDIGFWAPHVQKFDSCRAYWLVIDTLMSRDDKVAALGLLMHWLSQSDRIPLEQGETSFFRLTLRWLSVALDETGVLPEPGLRVGWKRIRRFFDYLEANAGEFWEVPEFAPELITNHPELVDTDDEDLDEEDELFSAAYENVVFRDSTDDGMDASIFDFDAQDEDYLQQMSRPIVDRLAFLEQLASTWRLIAIAWSSAEALQKPDAMDEMIATSLQDLLQNALAHLSRTAEQLRHLTEAVANHQLARSGTDPDSMVNYDRLRLLKESLLDQIINTNVCVIESQLFLAATTTRAGVDVVAPQAYDPSVVQLMRAVLRSDPATASQLWISVQKTLEPLPILYVPLSRNGNPKIIVRVKARQQLLQNLLHWLPRIGLLRETYQLIELVRKMERQVPVGSGAITEFDDLFEVACRATVSALIDATEVEATGEAVDEWLVTYLEEMIEPLLRSWLAHSRTLRLSVLEQVMEEEPWNELVAFIQRFGHDLFTQRFLNLGNVRGILHQGVESWLETLREFGGDEQYQPLIDALEHDLDQSEAADKLTLILEAIVESYSEYRDYNSTTTQSDRGEMLYTLLDFLRLRVSYDRVVWNLRPVVLAHKVLAERGCAAAAEQWRRSLQERIRSEAKRHTARLKDLEQKYAMRLPSISKRLGEQFMRPLLIDYLCALIQPAMLDPRLEARQSAFEAIRRQADAFMSEPSGAGLEVPAWLVAMEETVQTLKHEQEAPIFRSMEDRMLPPVKLTLDELQAQISWWREDKSE